METKDILKLLRKSCNLSMQDFCTQCGISFSTYQNYETGKRKPTADMLMIIADFYGVTTDYILGREALPQDHIMMLCQAYGLGMTERAIITAYCAMNQGQREEFMKHLNTLSGNVQKAKEMSKKKSQTIKEITPNLNRQNIPIANEEPPPPRYSYQYAARGSEWQGQTMNLTDDELEDLLRNSPEIPEDTFR